MSGSVVKFADDVEYLNSVMAELDGYYAELQNYETMEPDEVMLSVSGLLARLTAIRAECIRSQSLRANKLRTNEIEPLISALDQQFRIHSRLVSMRELDFKVTGAMV